LFNYRQLQLRLTESCSFHRQQSVRLASLRHGSPPHPLPPLNHPLNHPLKGHKPKSESWTAVMEKYVHGSIYIYGIIKDPQPNAKCDVITMYFTRCVCLINHTAYTQSILRTRRVVYRSIMYINYTSISSGYMYGRPNPIAFASH